LQGRVEYVNVFWIVALAGELVQMDLDDELDSKRRSERKTTSPVRYLLLECETCSREGWG
jgi:hypothetical protein